MHASFASYLVAITELVFETNIMTLEYNLTRTDEEVGEVLAAVAVPPPPMQQQRMENASAFRGDKDFYLSLVAVIFAASLVYIIMGSVSGDWASSAIWFVFLVMMGVWEAFMMLRKRRGSVGIGDRREP